MLTYCVKDDREDVCSLGHFLKGAVSIFLEN